MKLDVVVVRGEYLLEIGCEPGLGIRPKHPLDFFFAGHRPTVVLAYQTVANA
jgi:hypothetical protein